MIAPDLIDEAARRIAAAAPGARVILFGSHARGEAGPDSDVDLLVVEPRVADRFGESCACSACSRRCACRPTSIVVSEAHVEEWGDVAEHDAPRRAARGTGPCPSVTAAPSRA